MKVRTGTTYLQRNVPERKGESFVSSQRRAGALNSAAPADTFHDSLPALHNVCDSTSINILQIKSKAAEPPQIIGWENSPVIDSGGTR